MEVNAEGDLKFGFDVFDSSFTSYAVVGIRGDGRLGGMGKEDFREKRILMR